MPTIPSGKVPNHKYTKTNKPAHTSNDRGHDVVKAGFLAAGAAASTIVTLALIGATSRDGSIVAIAIGTVGAVFTAALLVAAIYVGRRQ
jgi:hypothetical protein